jgi:hypothetical protein
VNDTTPAALNLPGELAAELNQLLGSLVDWLNNASDAVHADLDRFNRTENGDPDAVWTLMEALSRYSIAVHHLTDPRQPPAASTPACDPVHVTNHNTKGQL